MTEQHFSDEDYHRLHRAHCITESQRKRTAEGLAHMAIAFVSSENENARLRRFIRFVMRYADGEGNLPHLAKASRETLGGSSDAAMNRINAAFRDTLVQDFENDERCEEILNRLRRRVFEALHV